MPDKTEATPTPVSYDDLANSVDSLAKKVAALIEINTNLTQLVQGHFDDLAEDRKAKKTAHEIEHARKTRRYV